MLEINSLEENVDAIDFLMKLTVKGINLADYIVQITTLDNSHIIFLSGSHKVISSFFKPIFDNEKLLVNKIIELKNNG